MLLLNIPVPCGYEKECVSIKRQRYDREEYTYCTHDHDCEREDAERRRGFGDYGGDRRYDENNVAH